MAEHKSSYGSGLNMPRNAREGPESDTLRPQVARIPPPNRNPEMRVSSEGFTHYRINGYQSSSRSILNPLRYCPEDRCRRRDNRLWETETKLLSQRQTGAALEVGIAKEWEQSRVDIANDKKPTGQYKEYRQQIARQVRAEWRARLVAGCLNENQMVEVEETLRKWVEGDHRCSRKARNALLLLAMTMPSMLRHVQDGESVDAQGQIISDLIHQEDERRQHRPKTSEKRNKRGFRNAVRTGEALLNKKKLSKEDNGCGLEVSANLQEDGDNAARLTININTKGRGLNPNVKIVSFDENDLIERETAEVLRSTKASGGITRHTGKIIIPP